MILRSSSGYCMPFEEPIKQDVQMSLGYGEQKNPVTGETFFHHGIDFSVNHYLLSAVATGTVSATDSRYDDEEPTGTTMMASTFLETKEPMT